MRKIFLVGFITAIAAFSPGCLHEKGPTPTQVAVRVCEEAIAMEFAAALMGQVVDDSEVVEGTVLTFAAVREACEDAGL